MNKEIKKEKRHSVVGWVCWVGVLIFLFHILKSTYISSMSDVIILNNHNSNDEALEILYGNYKTIKSYKYVSN